MHRKILDRIIAVAASSALMLSAVTVSVRYGKTLPVAVVSDAADTAVTVDDMPADFQTAAEWIWQNRIEREQSTVRRNTIFDQIAAGKGTLNYVVKWQSYRQLTYEQRQKFEKMLSDCVNGWNDWLKGYENWPYDHIDVKITGWAVIDKSCLLDLHDDEIVYTDTRYYDSQYDTTNGREEIPDKEPFAPDELSRMYHFENSNNPQFDAFNYPGGLEKRFDMYMWATQGFPDIGGCGGDWGQRLSDTAYMNMIDGENLHVLEHEIGHGFGIPDFYGGEGEADGYPPGGFPGGENSIMMAGSAVKITDFDGWLLRYMWTKIKDDEGRFDLADVQPVTTTTTAETTAITTTTVTTTEQNVSSETTKGCFADTIVNIEFMEEPDSDNNIGFIEFENNRKFLINADVDKIDKSCKKDDVVWLHFFYTDNGTSRTITNIDSFEIAEKKTITNTIKSFTSSAEMNSNYPDEYGYTGMVEFESSEYGYDTYFTCDGCSAEDSTNLSYYETGDVVKIECWTAGNNVSAFFSELAKIVKIDSIELIQDSRETTTTAATTTVQSATTTIAESTVPLLTTEDNLDVTVYGDANCDGNVTIADATAIIQYLGNADEYELSEQGKANADVIDRGGGVTGADANAVQAIEAGFIKQTDFPLEKAEFDNLISR